MDVHRLCRSRIPPSLPPSGDGSFTFNIQRQRNGSTVFGQSISLGSCCRVGRITGINRVDGHNKTPHSIVLSDLRKDRFFFNFFFLSDLYGVIKLAHNDDFNHGRNNLLCRESIFLLVFFGRIIVSFVSDVFFLHALLT